MTDSSDSVVRERVLIGTAVPALSLQMAWRDRYLDRRTSPRLEEVAMDRNKDRSGER